ncbi:hypothetical protein ACWGQ4_28595, partial [Streptomyces sp. NPDC055721]
MSSTEPAGALPDAAWTASSATGQTSGAAGDASEAAGTVERLTGLVAALRDHGFGIGTGETVDAGHALEAVGFTDRERVREALAATLLHGERQRPVFDRVFDLYFPLGGGEPAALDGTAA